jgi:Tol biopolymer transport system component
VWIYEMETGTFKRLTSGERDTFPCWTPDGKRLTFASGTGTRLRITWQAADGSEPPERLTDAEANVFPHSWSPDGRTLVFTEFGPSFARIRALRRGAASDPEILVSGPAGGGRVSPDGRWLAYVSNASGQDELYLRPFDRPGPSRQLTTAGGAHAEWSRDGRELFYGSGGNITALPIDTTRGLGAGPPRALFEDRYSLKARGYQDFDVLPDGRFVVVRSGPEETAPGVIHVVTGWFDQLRRAVPK